METHSTVLAREIARMEELAGYSPWGCDGDTAEHTYTHAHDHLILQPYHSHSTFRTPVEMVLPGNFSTHGVGVACIGAEALRPTGRPTAASKVSR